MDAMDTMDTTIAKTSNLVNALVICPHCGDFIFVEQINCAIFRHGSFKSNGEQIPPHSSKADCDAFYESGSIYGCGKPFKVLLDSNGALIAEPCDYV